MALRFVDGFDHYATADLGKKWTTSSAISIVAAAGRRSTAALRLEDFGRYAQKALDNQPTLIVGFAFRLVSLPASNAYVAQFLDSGTLQVDLEVTNTGLLQVRRAGSTILGTTTGAITVGSYAYIEFFATIHPSAGVIMVAVNGATVLNLTGQNTRNSGNSYANTVSLGASSSGAPDKYVDDVYICDGTGSAPHNTLLGDCRVDTLLPTSDGTHQQWTPSTPGTHYTLVDEAAPNTTDYVSSITVGHRETYGMQDLTAVTGTIYGVQLNLAAQKNDAGSRPLKALILSGGSEVLGTTVALSTGQLYHRHIQTTDPATGVAWTEAGVNAAQVGAEVA